MLSFYMFKQYFYPWYYLINDFKVDSSQSVLSDK